MEVFQSGMRIAMAQINPTVGDLEGNIGIIGRHMEMADQGNVDLVLFPELATTGYPPQDLILERSFIQENKKLLNRLIRKRRKASGVVGFVDSRERHLYNAAAVFSKSLLVGITYKTLLPTYDVFDEDRYFTPQKKQEIRPIPIFVGKKKFNLGIEICEDLWDEEYDIDVTRILAKRGADIIINISCSPFYIGKRSERERLLRRKSRENGLPIFYVNIVGGQDELVFDGQSMAMDASGHLIAIGKQFEEDLIITDIDLVTGKAEKIDSPPSRTEVEVFNALVLGIRDYFHKTGFRKAVIGMSGGIDSSLTACLATEALGKENVIGVTMPSKYSTNHGKHDAEELAKNLGILFVRFSIQDIVDAYHGTLEKPLGEIREHFNVAEEKDDVVADENIQPRARGNCLMDISNRLSGLGILVLNTGNKSELALGYCTLYGDMAGGIGALGDVSKLEVYKLARHVNEKAGKQIIPENVFTKTPSPELMEGQFDPFNFDIVSPLVDEIIENRRSKKELVEMGYEVHVVEDVYERIRRAEYKRRQAPPCIKVTRKAFGIGRKMPIINKFRG